MAVVRGRADIAQSIMIGSILSDLLLVCCQAMKYAYFLCG